jgi:hypothetical protein
LGNLPLPLFTKEGEFTSLSQREVRRDFIIDACILMTLIINMAIIIVILNGVRDLVSA